MKQETIVAVAIWLLVVISILAFVQNNYSWYSFYIECPQDTIAGCDNPLASTSILDTPPPEQLCTDYPDICSKQRLEAGEVLGSKPKGILPYIQYIFGIIILIAGGILYKNEKEDYYKKNEIKTKTT